MQKLSLRVTSAAALIGLSYPLTLSLAVSPSVPLPVPNGDFENGLANWAIAAADAGMSSLSMEQAASGKSSLKIVDATEKAGSDVTAARVPVNGAGVWTLRAKAFPVAGDGLGIYVRVLDKDGKVLGAGDDFQRGAPTAPKNQWVPFELAVYTGGGAAFLEVWIHSYMSAKVTAYLDDFVLEKSTAPAGPPWTPQYKIKAHETAKLTAADVVGPDGLVYPDWRYAGVPGGIPKTPVVARIEEFGGVANDDKDDSEALEKGAESVGKKGGALLLGAGTYHLDRPVLITRDNVVLRGAGRDQTKIIFRYGAPTGGVGFLRPAEGDVVTGSSWIEAHAAPKDLQAISIKIDDKLVSETRMHQHWGATFSVRTSGSALFAKVPDGAHKLTAVAEYSGGKIIQKTLNVTTNSKAPVADVKIPSQIGAIMFAGSSRTGQQLKLAQDGKRGDKSLLLENAAGIVAGERIRLRAPATPRWNALVRNACTWGDYRRYEFLVEGVNGNLVRLNQPLRIDYPVIDGSYVQEIFPIRGCGAEDLSLEQTQDIWTSGIVFSNAWECWARSVLVKKAGRFPLYCLPSKWCEIRDCVFDDAWFKGGGGTAYVGWEFADDCLMDNVETFKLRHAPLVQWTASGNVIRNSVFHDSDGQWHSGWTNENLFENCVIDSKVGNGSYGYGLWGSPPEDTAHGPNGPRNVVYNCDITSPKVGLWMGGMNEGWMILHNRFSVGSGPGIFAKTGSFDHTIVGNTVSLGDAKAPFLQLATPDCVGVEVLSSRIYGGSGKLTTGAAKPVIENGNQFFPAGVAPRSQPAVPSIFEWQRANKR